MDNILKTSHKTHHFHKTIEVLSSILYKKQEELDNLLNATNINHKEELLLAIQTLQNELEDEMSWFETSTLKIIQALKKFDETLEGFDQLTET